MRGQGIRAPGLEAVIWRCPQRCALVRVYLSASGWRVVRYFHAPEVAVDATHKFRPAPMVETLPLDLAEWPAGLGFAQGAGTDLACRHGARGRLDLAALAEDTRVFGASRKVATRTI